jgi:ATP-dependent DNA helicase RecQ
MRSFRNAAFAGRRKMLMEMQFRITEVSVPLDITVRIDLKMQEQPSVPQNGEGNVAACEMGNVPGQTSEQGQLFERLTTLRRQIASEAGTPPYIIFHDSTLMEMCRRLPRDMQEMKTVPGVGEAKLAKYGQRFLDVIAEQQS